MVIMTKEEILKLWNDNITENNSWNEPINKLKNQGIVKIRSCKNKPNYFDIQLFNGQTCYGIKFKIAEK